MAPPSAKWLIISLTPDVCLTKGVPVPYIIVSEAELADCESPNVVYNGRRSVTLSSLTTACKGDEAGDSGTASGTVRGICTPIEGSNTVFINTFQAMRQDDRFWMNLCNTVGKVVMVPAIAHPDDPGALNDADFRKSVAKLVADTLKASNGDPEAARLALTQLRNVDPVAPEVYNNPVVVAAQHFFIGMSQAKKAGVSKANVRIEVWEGLKKYPVLNYFKDRIAKSRFGFQMNPNHAESDYDPRVIEWSRMGAAAASGSKKGVAYEPSEQDLLNWIAKAETEEKLKGQRDAAEYIYNDSAKGLPSGWPH